jgi:NhaP-type Na+/H+ or K+/H+ antiporter
VKVTLKWLKLPFTVVLLLVGIGAGMWEKYQEQTNGLKILGDSMLTWASIDPHVFLFIFLPALLYEASSAVDVHIFGRAGMQMVLLAGPGVVISTCLTATVVQELFDYGWDWQTAMCFGSMMSATDPVAVVALLKELGASKRLSLLIEGESLLNDGTAMVVFMVFQKSMGAGAPPLTGSTVCESFVQLAGGGLVLGWVIGQITVFMLANIIDDPACEITLTITAAYGGFFLAEASAIGASGVLTVVVIGLVMSYSGKTAVSPSVEHFMHEFWEMMGFLANTIIFILSGLIIVEKYSDESIRNYDWGLCIALWLALNLIRGFVITLLSPVLTKLGYGLTIAQSLVITWGGLRGAVGLALAMIVEHDPNVDKRVGQLFLFHMAGIVILTLVVNGSTTGMLVRYLKLHKSPAAARKLFENAALTMDKRAAKSVATLKHNPFYSDADWAMVWNLMPIFTDGVVEERRKREAGFNPKFSTVSKASKALSDAYFDEQDEKAMGKTQILAVAKRAAQIGKTGTPKRSRIKVSDRAKSYKHSSSTMNLTPEQYATTVVNSDEQLVQFQFQQTARHMFFNLVKSNYWRQFETGFTSNNAHKALLDGANSAEDQGMLHDVMMQQLDEWMFVESYTQQSTSLSCMSTLPGLSYLSDFYLEKQYQLAYDIANSFILAHKESTSQFIHLLEEDPEHGHGHGHDDHGDDHGDDNDYLDPTALEKKVRGGQMDDMTKQIALEILQDSCYSMGRAQQYLDELKVMHPKTVVSIATKSVCYALLEDMKQHADHLSHHGELEEKEVGIVEKALLKSRKKLHFQFSKSQNSQATVLSSDEMTLEVLKRVPFFQLLSPELQAMLANNAELVNKNRGARLFDRGDMVDGIFVVMRGTVKICATNEGEAIEVETERIGNGETVGMLEVVTGQHKRLTSAECSSSVELIHIRGFHMEQLFRAETNIAVKEAVWRDAACVEVMRHRHRLPVFESLNPQATRLLLSKAQLLDGNAAAVHPLPGRGLLVRGTISDRNGAELTRCVSLWDRAGHPSANGVTFTEDTVLLVIDADGEAAPGDATYGHASEVGTTARTRRRTSVLDAGADSNAQAAAAVAEALQGGTARREQAEFEPYATSSVPPPPPPMPSASLPSSPSSPSSFRRSLPDSVDSAALDRYIDEQVKQRVELQINEQMTDRVAQEMSRMFDATKNVTSTLVAPLKIQQRVHGKRSTAYTPSNSYQPGPQVNDVVRAMQAEGSRSPLDYRMQMHTGADSTAFSASYEAPIPAGELYQQFTAPQLRGAYSTALEHQLSQSPSKLGQSSRHGNGGLAQGQLALRGPDDQARIEI